MSDSNDFLNAVKRMLWSRDRQDQGKIYAILDAARDTVIYPKLAESDNKKVCLLMGKQARELATVAPYLIELDEDDPFTQWLLDQGWGKSWGIFAESTATFVGLLNHFRKFFRVTDEDAKTLFFRYYDPRVLRVFLPTCDQEQLETIFGPVHRYVIEDSKDNQCIEYACNDQFKLIKKLINL
jgi:hypothetical protein